MREIRNIVLIGMPGAGKSTVGVVLAKKMGYGFLDSDLVIQEQEGRLLPEIIEEKGIEGFLMVENRINASLSAVNTVIATGGSVIYGAGAMEHLRQSGLVVYLEQSCAEILERLGDLTQRGVVIRPDQDLKSLYEERIPLYEKYADITVECGGRMIKEFVSEIEAAVKEKLRGMAE